MLLAGEDAEIAATVIEGGRVSLTSALGQPVGGSGGRLRRRTHWVDRLGGVDLAGGRLGLSSFRGTFLSTSCLLLPRLSCLFRDVIKNALVCTTP